MFFDPDAYPLRIRLCILAGGIAGGLLALLLLG